MAELKLVTPHYQHVDGTSFAAPLTASAAACVFQANPSLSSRGVREVLLASAQLVPNASVERQGHGALDPRKAVALGLQERHRTALVAGLSAEILGRRVRFALHDHAAMRVEVWGEWDGWQQGLMAEAVEPGLWRTPLMEITPGGYGYKFLLDGSRWLHDPDNSHKAPDGFGNLNAVLSVPADS